MFEYIYRWAKRRHPKKSKRWVKHKILSHTGERPLEVWFMDKERCRKATILPQKSNRCLKADHILIKGEANPYDTEYRTYFDKRHTRNILDHFNGGRYIRKYVGETDEKVQSLWRADYNQYPVVNDLSGSE